MRFFLQNVLKSKPICIITDLYHFLIRHTYFSLSQNTYPAPHSSIVPVGRERIIVDVQDTLIHGRSKIVMGGGAFIFALLSTQQDISTMQTMLLNVLGQGSEGQRVCPFAPSPFPPIESFRNAHTLFISKGNNYFNLGRRDLPKTTHAN